MKWRRSLLNAVSGQVSPSLHGGKSWHQYWLLMVWLDLEGGRGRRGEGVREDEGVRGREKGEGEKSQHVRIPLTTSARERLACAQLCQPRDLHPTPTKRRLACIRRCSQSR